MTFETRKGKRDDEYEKQKKCHSLVSSNCGFQIYMVPKGGLEPPRGYPTAPSRQRVCQFHHFGEFFIYQYGENTLSSTIVSVTSMYQAPQQVGIRSQHPQPGLRSEFLLAFPLELLRAHLI